MKQNFVTLSQWEWSVVRLRYGTQKKSTNKFSVKSIGIIHYQSIEAQLNISIGKWTKDFKFDQVCKTCILYFTENWWKMLQYCYVLDINSDISWMIIALEYAATDHFPKFIDLEPFHTTTAQYFAPKDPIAVCVCGVLQFVLLPMRSFPLIAVILHRNSSTRSWSNQ